MSVSLICRLVGNNILYINTEMSNNRLVWKDAYLILGPRRSTAVRGRCCRPPERCSHMLGHLRLWPPLSPPWFLRERQPSISFQENIQRQSLTGLNVEIVIPSEHVTNSASEGREGHNEKVTSEAINNLISHCFHTLFFYWFWCLL